jgi:hypothetical protein
VKLLDDELPVDVKFLVDEDLYLCFQPQTILVVLDLLHIILILCCALFDGRGKMIFNWYDVVKVTIDDEKQEICVGTILSLDDDYELYIKRRRMVLLVMEEFCYHLSLLTLTLSL